MLLKLKRLLPSPLTLKQQIALSLFLNLGLVFLLHSPSSQTYAAKTTYYVAPNGSDTNPGTIDKPWQHISYAADNSIVKPGDTIYIRGGVYNEAVNLKVSGAPDKFVTYRNYPGEKPIISDVGAKASWRWLIKDQSYIRIEGLTFQDYRKGAIQIRTYAADLSHIEIINNNFLNQKDDNGDTRKTIHVSTLDSGHYLYDVTIAGNYFQNMNTGVKPMLQVEGNLRGVRILNNVIVGASNIAINVAGRPTIGQPERVLVKGNDVSGHGLPGEPIAGIYLDGAGRYIVVEENVVHEGRQGIKVDLESEASSLQTEYVIVRRNVLYNNYHINLKLGVGSVPDNCGKAGTLQYGTAVHNTVYSDQNTTNNWFSCGTNLSWKNNVFAHVGNSGYQHRLENTTVNPSTWQSDHNYFYSIGTKPFRWFNTNYNTLAGFQSISGLEQHSDMGVPLFADVNQRDFSLTATSPLRDAGGELTITRSAGSGMVVAVQEAWYFSDGLGLQSGDLIRIGSNPPVQVVSIDYEDNLLIIDQPLTWVRNTPINYNYSDSNPDAGAFEFVPSLTMSGIPQDQAIFLTWQLNDDLSDILTWRIEYQVVGRLQEVSHIDLPSGKRSHQLKGLENYQMYHVILSAIVDGQAVLTQEVNVMPTDIFAYLPIVLR